MKTHIFKTQLVGKGKATRIAPFPQRAEVISVSINEKTREVTLEFIPKRGHK